MTISKTRIAVYAAVICMAVVAVMPMMDDADVAATPVSDFVTAVNGYNNGILGPTQSVVSASTDGASLTIAVNTSQADIESLALNLSQPYTDFTSAFAGFTVGVYDNYGEGGTQRSTIQIIDNGTPKNVSEFGIRVLQQVKNAVAADQDFAPYDGAIIINGTEYSLKVVINLSNEFKAVSTTLLTSGMINVKSNYSGGALASMDVTVNMDQDLYNIIQLSQADLKNAKVSDVVDKFAADGVLGTLISGDANITYVNTICTKIKGATGFASLLANNVAITVDNADVRFTAPTISQKSGFQGLMETLSDAMEANFGTVGTYVSSTNVGALVFKQMGIKLMTGLAAAEFGTLKVNPTLTYGATYVTLQADEVPGLTITFVPSSNILPGDVVTVNVQKASPGLQITTLKYYVNNVEKANLDVTKESQPLTILFGEGVHKVVATVSPLTITWMNGDTVLKVDQVGYGVTPVYSGETPTKAETDKYTYQFAGWDPEVVPATVDAVYKAVFTEITKPVVKEEQVEFISDSEEKVVTAKISDIKAADKETVVIGKSNTASTATVSNWTVDIATEYFESKTESTVSITLADVTEEVPQIIPESVVKKIEGMTVISIDMTLNQEKVSKLGTTVTVTFSYTPKAGENTDKLAVYYIDTDKGTLQRYDATFEDGYVTFDTDHFSYWVVGEELSFAPVNDGLLLASLLVLAIIAPIIIALFVYKKE